MSKQNERILAKKDTAKTMSTLQMWQQQMAALQRASQVRAKHHTNEGESAAANDLRESRSISQLVYPLLP